MATGKKHAFGRNEAEKFISASHGYPLKTLLRIYVQGKDGGVDRGTHKNAGLAEAKLHWFILVPECVELG